MLSAEGLCGNCSSRSNALLSEGHHKEDIQPAGEHVCAENPGSKWPALCDLPWNLSCCPDGRASSQEGHALYALQTRNLMLELALEVGPRMLNAEATRWKGLIWWTNHASSPNHASSIMAAMGPATVCRRHLEAASKKFSQHS